MAKVKHVNREETTIYALIDPRTGLPFYIGSTWFPINIRLTQHITEANQQRLSPSKKSQRLMEIKRANERPIILALEVCLTCVRDIQEEFWVCKTEQQGIALTNTNNSYSSIYTTRKRGFWNI